MRIAAVFCIVLLCGAGAKADVLDDLLAALKPIAGQALQGTSSLVMQYLQDFLNNNAIGKRDLSPMQIQAFIQQASQTILAHLGPAKDAILANLQKLFEHAKQISSLSWVNKGTSKRELLESVDVVVEQTKRQMTKDLNTIVNQLLQALSGVAQTVLGQVGQQLVDQINKPSNVIGKRAIIDYLQPHIDTITGIASNIGSALSGHATNVWNTVQGHVNTLGTALQPHIDTISGHVSNIIGHGQNGIDAIQDAVTDILNQTFQNISGNVSGIADAGSAAVGTVVDHVSGAVGGK
ncbi:uncharacterized protein LOC135495143 [Lineus longissimus]|uniref:uncharacterized protein LOC135495143 n=1 Tax=Lineus longissimus TaxID=88925 RepID=UPI002B4C2E14